MYSVCCHVLLFVAAAAVFKCFLPTVKSRTSLWPHVNKIIFVDPVLCNSGLHLLELYSIFSISDQKEMARGTRAGSPVKQTWVPVSYRNCRKLLLVRGDNLSY